MAHHSIFSGHASIADQIANSVVHSATSHSVGALMRGRGTVGVIAIAVLLVAGVWLVKKLF